ncbi:MAG: hypothetical protein R2848_11145 [Thermomicrobiales bacterium]
MAVAIGIRNARTGHEIPISNPTITPGMAPSAKPARMRSSEIQISPSKFSLRNMSLEVPQSDDGAGQNR